MGRYVLLKSAVGFGVFLFTCPLAFLLTGAFASVVPVFIAFALIGILYIFGSLLLTHIITEKLSKRWSR